MLTGEYHASTEANKWECSSRIYTGYRKAAFQNKRKEQIGGANHRADDDADIRDLAESERCLYKEAITDLKHKIISLLIPSEESDGSDLIMEVTAGVGGQEAMLFTAEMFDMYQNFASFRSWRFEILEYFPSEIGYEYF
ncbi:UNVERIFIED_CONTAM: hypothetical protein FKN15_020173 [Acipenser sinensis]